MTGFLVYNHTKLKLQPESCIATMRHCLIRDQVMIKLPADRLVECRFAIYSPFTQRRIASLMRDEGSELLSSYIAIMSRELSRIFCMSPCLSGDEQGLSNI